MTHSARRLELLAGSVVNAADVVQARPQACRTAAILVTSVSQTVGVSNEKVPTLSCCSRLAIGVSGGSNDRTERAVNDTASRNETGTDVAIGDHTIGNVTDDVSVDAIAIGRGQDQLDRRTGQNLDRQGDLHGRR